ncbi:MAG: hypothetical protein SFT81_02060 [Candidatus Caenarcaniphilales bacterium]|nr:hypothetical protein [Candidatus Caenarcaniphilales bacterium]
MVSLRGHIKFMQEKFTPEGGDMGWKVARFLLFGALVWMLANFFVNKYHHFFEGDTSWLYRTGQYILSQHKLPAYDLYSWTDINRPWILYQWLYELLIAFIARLIGFRETLAVGLVYSCILFLVFPSLQKNSRRIPFLFFTLSGLLGLITSAAALSLRPNLVTLSSLALQFIALPYYRAGQIKAKVFFPVLFVSYALWSNCHMGFSLGILSLILTMLGDILARSGLYRADLNDKKLDERTLSIKEYLIMIALAFVATGVNPYGWGLWSYLYDLSTQSEIHLIINELNHLNFSESYGKDFLILAMIILSLSVKAKKHFNLSGLIHLIAFGGLTIASSRFLVWFGIYAALILPYAIYQAYFPHRDSFTVFRELVSKFDFWKKPLVFILCISSLIVLVLAVIYPPKPNPCEKYKPAIRAYLKYLRKHPATRLGNDDHLGNCLILYSPYAKVYIDSRFDMYGEDYVLDWYQELMLAKNWQRFIHEKKIDLVMISNDWELAHELEKAKDFRLLYRDQEAVIYAKRNT